MEPTPAQVVRVGTATTVPLRRLGALLRAARSDADLSIGDVADRSDGAFDVVDLAEVEAGQRSLDDDQVVSLLALYHADPGDLLASRSTLVIDLDEGTVAAGPWSTSFSPGGDTADDVLARYLALLYEMRNLEPGTPLSLRTLDVSVLASALALPPTDVEQRLVVLMDPADGRVERLRSLLRRRVLVPAAGLVVAATSVGVLTIVQDSTPAAPGAELGRSVGSASATALAPESAVSIGGLQIEAPPQVAPPGADEPEIGEGLTIEAPPQVAPPGADEPEIGDALTIERSTTEP